MSSKFIEEFVAAGRVPENCTRIIIDIRKNDVVRLYYETMPSKDTLRGLGLNDLLHGGFELPALKIEEAPDATPET